MDHCAQRHRCGVEGGFKPLSVLVGRHEGADIYAHSGAVLPVVLGAQLLSKGFAEDALLNSILISTGQFEPQDENPLWKRMVHWGDSSLNDLEALICEGNYYLFKTTPVDAGPYLQIADSMLRIQEYGGLEIARAKLTNKIVKRVQHLGNSAGVQAAKFGTQFGWEKRQNQFFFGGYGCDANDDFLQIMETMNAVQLELYDQSIEEEAEGLLSDFETDLKKFFSDIEFGQDVVSFYRTPILNRMDIGRFASATLKYLGEGQRKELGNVFEKIAERHQNNGEWEDEKSWFLELRRKLETSAAKHSRLASAQLKLFLKYHWKIVEPEILDFKNEPN